MARSITITNRVVIIARMQWRLLSPRKLSLPPVMSSFGGHGQATKTEVREQFDLTVVGSGLYSIAMSLVNRDGLYYCPTDVFAVDKDPVRCNVPIIRRAKSTERTPATKRIKNFITVSQNQLAESELWMRSGLAHRVREDQLDLLQGKVTGSSPRASSTPSISIY